MPPLIRQELMRGLADRRREVVRKLEAMTPAHVEPARDRPQHAAPAHAAPDADPEESLRVLMVRWLPQFVRRRADAAAARDALRLLAHIAEPARSGDFRFFDAFNNFWEHWPLGLDAEADHRFARAYRELLEYHLDHMPA